MCVRARDSAVCECERVCGRQMERAQRERGRLNNGECETAIVNCRNNLCLADDETLAAALH